MVQNNYERNDSMNTVPNIIGTKDLSYLEDMFGWNLNASKKAHHFSEESTDMDVKTCLKEAAMMHAEHCRKLASILEKGAILNEQQSN